MRIIFTTSFDDSGTHRKAGELVEVPDDRAQQLIDSGVARRHEVGPTETKENGGDDSEETEHT